MQKENYPLSTFKKNIFPSGKQTSTNLGSNNSLSEIDLPSSLSCSRLLLFQKKKFLIVSKKTLILFCLSKNLSKLKKLFKVNLPSDFSEIQLLEAKFFDSGFILYDFSNKIWVVNIIKKTEHKQILLEKPKSLSFCQESNKLFYLDKYHHLNIGFLQEDTPKIVIQHSVNRFDWQVVQMSLDSPRKVKFLNYGYL